MKHLAILPLALLLFANSAFSQETFGTVSRNEDYPGSELQGAKITVKHRVPALFVLSDSEGNWKMEIPEGYDTLVATMDGFISREIALGPEDRMNMINIQLDQSRFSGTVTDEYDQPIEGATVMAMGVFPKLSAITDAQGNWVLETDKGIENLKFMAENYASKEVFHRQSTLVKLHEVEFPEMSVERMIEYVNEGHDLNKPFGTNATPEFQLMFWSYGYHCLDELQPAVYRALEVAKTPIKNPLFFLNDPCNKRAKDILDYFSLLVKHNHGVTEADFLHVVEVYSAGLDYEGINPKDWHTVDVHGKSVLIYATELGYVQTVKRLLESKADKTLKDKSGKTAYDYAKANANKELMALLK